MSSWSNTDRARDTLQNEPRFLTDQYVVAVGNSGHQSNELIRKMMQLQTVPNTIDIPLRMVYVYALIDPRSDSIFYVGKGQRERILHHAGQVVVVEHPFQDNVDNEDNSNTEAPRTEKEGPVGRAQCARRPLAALCQGHRV